MYKHASTTRATQPLLANTALTCKKLSMNAKDKRISRDDIEKSKLYNRYDSRICDIFCNLEILWRGRLGNLKVAELAIKLKEGAKQLQSAIDWFEPSTLHLEAFKL